MELHWNPEFPVVWFHCPCPMQGVASVEGPQEMGISKKDPLVRVQELLGKGNGSMAQGLTSLASRKAVAMLRHGSAADVAVEIARGGEHGEWVAQ